jgi:hypothetical protein
MSDPADSFFIGWLGSLPARLRLFLRSVGLVLALGLCLLGLALSVLGDDPGSGDFEWNAGAQTVRGVLTLAPYPMIHATDPGANGAVRSLILVGVGKHGAPLVGGEVAGSAVAIEGYAIRRGAIEMLQVEDPPAATADSAAPIQPVALGRWRVSGEICDGKCYLGAMKPGTGLAHRACARLCLRGEVPAILVASAPVAGSDFLLLADADGNAPSEQMRSLTAVPVTVEGEVERIGSIAVIKVAHIEPLSY